MEDTDSVRRQSLAQLILAPGLISMGVTMLVRAGRLEYNPHGSAGRAHRTNRHCVAGTDRAVQEVLCWKPCFNITSYPG